MNVRQIFGSLLSAMICLSLVTGMAIAQQPNELPFETGAIQDTPQDNAGLQEPVIVRPTQDPAPRRPFGGAQDLEDPQNQETLVNVRYAGWEEVTQTIAGERISDTIRGNWVMIDENGRFDGRVTPGRDADISNMNVFLMNKGRLVKQTIIKRDGRFEFTNVRQGAYSLIGWAPNGFFAFGVNILAYNPENNGVIVNTVNATAYQNQTTINTDWIKYFTPQVAFRVYGRYPVGQGRDDPAELYGFQGLYENLPVSTLATSISGRPVVKSADGSLTGRIHQLNSISGRPVDVRTTRVMLFQGDGVVASTTTDNFGGFAFPPVPDGSYGVTAAGVDGVGMIAIDVVSSVAGDIAAAPTPIDFTMTSSETIGWLNNYASQVAYRRALLAPRPPSQPEGCVNCGNQGCDLCRARNKANCNSRMVTFKQWAQSGCQCDAQKYGDGSILAGWAAQQRKNVQKTDDIWGRAFYPDQDISGFSQPPAPAVQTPQ